MTQGRGELAVISCDRAVRSSWPRPATSARGRTVKDARALVGGAVCTRPGAGAFRLVVIDRMSNNNINPMR